ncbi:MAG: ComF family protein [Burkholderia contaminans]|uniref:Phosphoribosyltransferase family protein n=1 Tax=Burkholderia contaminans TaxID=488447 RepID=A0AAP4R7C8_9BURK|nr:MULTISPECIES: phosphoribosyltransferase family protein [Burkholderia]MBD1414077.1 ComF family protein [Burkholderia contaminans]MBH9670809.1 ComF family protein [Burkholderia contaminans]MBH9677759.1 ComF family protein [Burkholderia contaminans]MBH9708183.1 ComF family protein [Burkholderia contaminans]MBH9722539.1 ComF family protein [Burkholderia contaminans]
MIRSSARRTMRVALSQVRALAARVAAVALPNRCALCGNLSHAVICSACDAAYWNEARLRCDLCALPLGIGPPRLPSQRGGARNGRVTAYRCDACRAAPPPFDATLALADYCAPLDGLARGLKFHRKLALGTEFAARLARLVDDTPGAGGFDLVAPVPLSHRRLVARGYNQAWAIARPLARRLGVRADAALLARVADTAPQSRLDRHARRDNVMAAFAVAGGVAGRHVALVDDVMTSGATLAAAAHALKAAGAARVTNLVALRTARD